MKITPFYSNKRTFAKLTFVEWAFTFLAVSVTPVFLNTVLGWFSKDTVWIYPIFVVITVIADIYLIKIKGKEENFIFVLYINRFIPDKIEGYFPDVTPISNLKNSNEQLLSVKK